MDHQNAEALAENLKGLACIECTKGWLAKHEGLTDIVLRALFLRHLDC